MRNFHGPCIVGNDNELGVADHLEEDLGKSAYVFLVKRGVNLIQKAEGAGMDQKSGKKERNGC